MPSTSSTYLDSVANSYPRSAPSCRALSAGIARRCELQLREGDLDVYRSLGAFLNTDSLAVSILDSGSYKLLFIADSIPNLTLSSPP